MHCKACNTRLPRGATKCPHCGHGGSRGGFIDRPRASDANEDSQSAAPGKLAPSSLAGEEEMELSLDEAVTSKAVTSKKSDGSSPARKRARGGARTASKAKSAAKPQSTDRSRAAASKSAQRRASAPAREAERGEAARRAARPPSRKPSPPAEEGVGLVLDTEQVRHLVSEHPEALEPGLAVLTDDDGRPVGIGYDTEVGEIELLARDGDGDWVVVMVSPPNPGPELVSELLHRMGWVRKHMREAGEKVRGILVLDGMDEELGYAAAAVADSVDFRAWRLEVSFEAIDV